MKEIQKAILVGVNVNRQNDFEYLMEELAGLAVACNHEVVGKLTQNLNRINKSQYIGTGKVQELTNLLNMHDANLVIFNDELTPSQIRILEEKLEMRVIDRTMLILDIFALRAKTRESQLQVEVAKLEYMLPRLVGQGESLGRQGGGTGLKNRGAGETKLELDRRKIEERISALSKELEDLVNQRNTQRKHRNKSGVPVVSLVGYTNAGKSTIMNALVEGFNTGKDKLVFEKNMLFATLETSVRNIKLDNNKTFLLTDTVGFVNKLPHHLIKAFRSTLEEVAEADLLIHVIDYSNEHHEEMKDLTNEILHEIGIVDNIPIIYAYNKSDLTDCKIPNIQNDRVFLSAKKRIGIEELTLLISQHIFKDYVQCELLIPYTEGQNVSYFNEHSHVLSVDYEDGGTKLKVECNKGDAERFQRYVRNTTNIS